MKRQSRKVGNTETERPYHVFSVRTAVEPIAALLGRQTNIPRNRPTEIWVSTRTGFPFSSLPLPVAAIMCMFTLFMYILALSLQQSHCPDDKQVKEGFCGRLCGLIASLYYSSLFVLSCRNSLMLP